MSKKIMTLLMLASFATFGAYADDTTNENEKDEYLFVIDNEEKEDALLANELKNRDDQDEEENLLVNGDDEEENFFAYGDDEEEYNLANGDDEEEYLLADGDDEEENFFAYGDDEEEDLEDLA